MSGDLVRVEDDDLPRAMQDAETLRLLGSRPSQVAAVERGLRTWPDGMTEDYQRVEFR